MRIFLRTTTYYVPDNASDAPEDWDFFGDFPNLTDAITTLQRSHPHFARLSGNIAYAAFVDLPQLNAYLALPADDSQDSAENKYYQIWEHDDDDAIANIVITELVAEFAFDSTFLDRMCLAKTSHSTSPAQYLWRVTYDTFALETRPAFSDESTYTDIPAHDAALFCLAQNHKISDELSWALHTA